MEIELLEITAPQVTPKIVSLFDLTKPTMPRAFNVLEGIIRGQILVDPLPNPTTAVVRAGIYGTLYFGGDKTATLLASLVQHFREIGEVGIGCSLDEPVNELIPTDFDYDGRTYFFTERSSGDEKQVSQLPDGYKLVARDEHLVRKSSDYQSTLDAYGIAGELGYDDADFSAVFEALRQLE